jgi:Fic family protein
VKLQTTVATKTKASKRTIQERIADLVSLGVLEKRGATRTTEYKGSGLI